MLVTQQIIHNLFSALRFQENYKAVLCTCAGSHYKLSTVCSVLFVFRKITKQCSALVPALITNYPQFVQCSSFSGKLQSSALHLCRLSLQIIYNLFIALRFQENYKAVLCIYAGYLANYLQFVKYSSFSGILRSSRAAKYL